MIKQEQKITIWTLINRYVLPAGYFLFFFLFVFIYIDPRFIYSNNGFDLNTYVRFLHALNPADKPPPDPGAISHHIYILELTGAYFRDLFSAPGCLTQLSVTLFIYGCHHRIVGAILLTGLGWLMFFLIGLVIRKKDAFYLTPLEYAPPAFLFLLCGWYDLNYLAYIIPVIGALLGALVYEKIARRNFVSRLLGFAALFWTTYYLFHWGCALFAGIILVRGAFKKSKTPIDLWATAGFSVGLVYLLEHYLIAPEKAFNVSKFFAPLVLPIVILGFVPFVMLVSDFSVFLLARPRQESTRPKLSMHPALHCVVHAVILFFFTYGLVYWAHKDPITKEIRSLARTLHYVLNKNFNAILAESDFSAFNSFPTPDKMLMISAMDRALYNAGLLGSAMYRYPQTIISTEPLLLFQSAASYGFPNWAVALDLYMDLGALNYAEKLAGETMENMGPYPFLIYRRAIIQLAKGNVEVASVYLKRLKGLPFYRKEAGRLLGLCNNRAAPTSDTMIASLRARMDTTGGFLFLGNEETILLNLLKSDPSNKMAYEYLMAYYLQSGNIDGVARNIRQAPKFGYATIPEHWEEALCIYLTIDTNRRAEFRDLPLKAETFATFNRFLDVYTRLESNPAMKRVEPQLLAKEFGTTYFFYTFEIGNGAK